MRTGKMLEMVREYRRANLKIKGEIIRRVWGSDGLAGLESLSWMSGVEIDQLSSIAGIVPNVARARARRAKKELRRPRQPIPRGFRAELHEIANRAGHGRGFMPKRRWEPLHPTR